MPERVENKSAPEVLKPEKRKTEVSERVENKSAPEVLKPEKRKTEVITLKESPKKMKKTPVITIVDDVEDDVPTPPRSTLKSPTKLQISVNKVTPTRTRVKSSILSFAQRDLISVNKSLKEAEVELLRLKAAEDTQVKKVKLDQKWLARRIVESEKKLEDVQRMKRHQKVLQGQIKEESASLTIDLAGMTDLPADITNNEDFNNIVKKELKSTGLTDRDHKEGASRRLFDSKSAHGPLDDDAMM